MSGEAFIYAPDPPKPVVVWQHRQGTRGLKNAGWRVALPPKSVTSNHVLELEGVLPDGQMTRMAFVRREIAGTGFACAVCHRASEWHPRPLPHGHHPAAACPKPQTC